MATRNVAEIINSDDEFYRRLETAWSNNLRVACPGIVQSFDPTTQTATVQLAIREQVRNEDLSQEWVSISLLLDVPVVFPRAGNYCLTMPVNQGDECLVVFSDMCIDAWWTSGGVQNQMEKRRHDLSDGIAIMGLYSQPNKITNYSTTSAQLRTTDGATYIDLKPGEININATSVKVNGKTVMTST